MTRSTKKRHDNVVSPKFIDTDVIVFPHFDIYICFKKQSQKAHAQIN